MTFLTILTRTHPGREQYLAANQRSLADQTDDGYEQIVLDDTQCRGLHWANCQFAQLAPTLPLSDYVLMLDDDNVLIDPDAVRRWRQAARSMPDIIIHQAIVGPHGVLPTADFWLRGKYEGAIDGHCALVQSRLWLDCIDAFCNPVAGDASFFRAVFAERPTVVSIIKPMVRALRVGSLNWEG